MSKAPQKARWWFAWRPVKTIDTHRWMWLKQVYREHWFETLYFEHPGKERLR